MTDSGFILHFILSATIATGTMLLLRRMVTRLEAAMAKQRTRTVDDRVIAAALAWYDDRKGSKDELRAAVEEFRGAWKADREKYVLRGSQLFIPTPRALEAAEHTVAPVESAPLHEKLVEIRIIEAAQGSDLESKRAEMQHALSELHDAVKPANED